MTKKAILAGVLILAAVVLLSGTVTSLSAGSFSVARSALDKHIFSGGFADMEIRDLDGNGERPFVVFVSVGDRQHRAVVVSATGKTLRDAFDNAMEQAEQVPGTDSDRLIRVDVVETVENISDQTLGRLISSERSGHFRKGISFDGEFSTALLEGELNANRILDHENGVLDLEMLNIYRNAQEKELVNSLPEEFLLFTCRGFLYESGKCYTLENEQGAGYGIREREEQPTAKTVKEIVDSNIRYLKGSIGEDGSFVYCYYAGMGSTPGDYNILRHAGTMWELAKYAGAEKDSSLRQSIERSADYLLQSVVYKDEQTAFLVERDVNEVKVGGNGLALLALIEYERAYGTGRYLEVCRQLGNGIADMMDPSTGKLNHVYYYGEPGQKDFALKDAWRISYYDGEAAYALCLLHGLTGEQRWLDLAVKAVDSFLRDGNENHNDQWVAYTLNEITKFEPKEEYFHFALANLSENLPKIQAKKTASFTSTEQLMCYYELIQRMKERNKALPSSATFTEEELVAVIHGRADFVLNSYFYPETAMYMGNPARVEGVVFIREDNFRVRIDDVQHFLGGYQNYRRHFAG